MKKYICPNKDSCKQVCDHKETHPLDDSCTYRCRIKATGPYLEVKCRPLTADEQIIADY